MAAKLEFKKKNCIRKKKGKWYKEKTTRSRVNMWKSLTNLSLHGLWCSIYMLIVWGNKKKFIFWGQCKRNLITVG